MALFCCALFLLMVSLPLLNARAESVVALSFDGKNDFVAIPSGALLGEKFTEEAWILPQSKDTKFHGVVGHHAESAKRSPSLWIAYGTGIHAGFGDGKKWNSVSSELDAVVVNEWNHIAATYDGTTYRVFANGVEVVVKRLSATPMRQAITQIGRVDNCFAGAIREVRLWNRALAPEEIRRRMTKTLDGREEGLVAYFPLDDGAGEMARNAAAGGGGDGTLMNGPHWITSTASIAPAVFDPQLWEARGAIESYSPRGENATPSPLIEITFRDGAGKVDPDLIQLAIDNTVVKPEAAANNTGNLHVSYEPAEPFIPGSKHTVKITYVTLGPKSRTNDFSYSFSVSASILLSK